MSTFSLPDRTVSDWWDWKQPCGRIIRICYVNRFHTSSEREIVKNDKKVIIVDKISYCWESIRDAYTQKTLELIGGSFRPVPIEEF